MELIEFAPKYNVRFKLIGPNESSSIIGSEMSPFSVPYGKSEAIFVVAKSSRGFFLIFSSIQL